MKKRLLILLIVLTGTTVKSQFLSKPIIIESGIHSGLSLPFYKALDYLIEDYIYAFDISITLPAYGKDHWEKLYNYPGTGAGYSYWTLGNNEVLGTAHALYGFLNIPVIRKTGKYSINLKTSAGAAYITRDFDIDENHLNRAIGSNTNIYIRLGLDYRIRLLPGSELVFGTGISHFSNGKTRSPNYGINAGSLFMGLNYLFNGKNIPVIDPEIPEPDKKNIHSIILSAGSKVYDNLLDNKYLSTSLTYNIERHVNHWGKAGLGAALFYDGSIQEALELEKDKPDADFSNLVRIGLHASYTCRYKDFMAGIQVGHYVYSKYKILTHIYNRISIQYLVTGNIMAIIAIKSHWGKADCLEYGLGYTW